MGAPGDGVRTRDWVAGALSPPSAPDELPQWLRCPAGHRVLRTILRSQVIWPGGDTSTVEMPCYPCGPCTVVYRYQECDLIPGDEGAPA